MQEERTDKTIWCYIILSIVSFLLASIFDNWTIITIFTGFGIVALILGVLFYSDNHRISASFSVKKRVLASRRNGRIQERITELQEKYGRGVD